ncbi:MAG: hypothetical protein ACM3SV_01335 [Betaproteobacteria bacterium]
MKTKVILVFALLALLAGCAAEVTRYPTSLSQGAPAGKTYVVGSEVVYTLDSGRRRIIPARMKLTEFGIIPQGQVLKPVDAFIVIGGAHHHEAYAVVNGNILTGFYLPVEKAFSPLPNPVSINLKEQ